MIKLLNVERFLIDRMIHSVGKRSRSERIKARTSATFLATTPLLFAAHSL